MGSQPCGEAQLAAWTCLKALGIDGGFPERRLVAWGEPSCQSVFTCPIGPQMLCHSPEHEHGAVAIQEVRGAEHLLAKDNRVPTKPGSWPRIQETKTQFCLTHQLLISEVM